MPLTRKTPLAWKNLTHDWRRLVVALGGIGFAVLLMFTQVGFQNALFDSQVKIIDDLQGDIFMVSKAKYMLAAEKRFPLARLNQAQSCEGVAGAYPLYSELTLSELKNLTPNTRHESHRIRSLGFHLGDPVFKPTGEENDINRQLSELSLPSSALIDIRSKEDKFPFPLEDPKKLAEAPVELANKKLSLVGTFEMGTDFAHDGNLVMSAENFAKYYPQRNRFADPLAVVDLGIIHLEPGADADVVQQRLKQLLGRDVGVYTREKFRADEVKFWDDSTPIGIVFTAGKIIGFIVGMVICYQVIYSDIADHMPEFATLKAMGYTSKYFVVLIVTEAVVLSLIGFIPGMAVSYVLYRVLASSTGLLMLMTWQCMTLVLSLTLVMCVASGLLAVRKLLSADPASLF